jgi:hypothetical protein
MIDRLEIRPRDKILLLYLPEPVVIAELAGRACEGLVVALGCVDAVREARRACDLLENVMFVPAEAEEIPWRDEFFSVAADFECRWDRPEAAARELARVLESGARAYVVPSARAALLAAGLVEIGSQPSLLVVQKR